MTRGGASARTWIAAGLALGFVVFGLNNAGALSAWLAQPSGYFALWLPHTDDVAQYVTWVHAYRHAWLLPNFHAPWSTQPALLNPALATVGHLAEWLHLSDAAALVGLNLVAHVLAGVATVVALRTWTDSTAQRLLVVVALIASIPLDAVVVTPSALRSFLAGDPTNARGFAIWASDGFLHGINNSPLVTAGTTAVILTFSLLSLAIERGNRRFLHAALVVLWAGTLIHPFEGFVVVLAWFGLTVVLRRPPLAGAIGAFGPLIAYALGLAPYVALSLAVPWLRFVSLINRWPVPPLGELLVGLGGVAVVAIAVAAWTLWARARRQPRPVNDPASGPSTDDLRSPLLACWVLAAMIGVHLPLLPWSQHLFDGFHLAAAVLVARELPRAIPRDRLRWAAGLRSRAAFVVAAAVLVLSCGLPLSAYYRTAWREARAPVPRHFASYLMSVPEQDLIDWLRAHAEPEDLVLAPPNLAPWVTTAPVHSFASHFVFSMYRAPQRDLARQFYAGSAPAEWSTRFLTRYGFRFVVVPDDAPTAIAATLTIPRARIVAQVGQMRIVELPGQRMTAYAVGLQ